VEDVKTFLRFIPLAIVGGALAGSILKSDTIRYKLFNDISITESNIAKCYFEASFTHTIYYGAAILIPLYEILIYPIFHRCSPRMESHRKILLGMVVLIVKLLTLMAYNVISRHNSQQMNGPNITTSCLFETSKGVLSTSFSYKWIIVPDFLTAISVTMLYIGVIELISAQVPFFMKGLVIGMTYCSFYVFGVLWLAVSLPFVRIHSIWGTGTLSCGFWYILLFTIVDMGIFLILAILSRWYKKRQRQDVLPNEHFFAER
jgi:NADH:ubiquinone oxidoreductase subunit K